MLYNNWPAYSGYALDTDTAVDESCNANLFSASTIGNWIKLRLVKNGDGTYRIMSTYDKSYRSLDADMADVNAGKTAVNCIFYPYWGNGNEKWTLEPVNFGCAWAMNNRYNGSRTQSNCFGYALGVNAIPPVTLSHGESIDAFITNIINYVTQTLHRGFRPLKGPTSVISSNEYRICLRIGDNGDICDYHFWLQCNDGSWCDKHGHLNDESSNPVPEGYKNPSTAAWNLTEIFEDGSKGVLINFYKSDTRYFAVTL